MKNSRRRARRASDLPLAAACHYKYNPIHIPMTDIRIISPCRTSINQSDEHLLLLAADEGIYLTAGPHAKRSATYPIGGGRGVV